MYTPIVVPDDTQLVKGYADVLQQIPRAESAAPPFEVTVAPKVAVLVLIAVAVGRFTTGIANVVNVPSGE